MLNLSNFFQGGQIHLWVQKWDAGSITQRLLRYVEDVQYLKSRWNSPNILVYKDPLQTYLLVSVSVPSILTLRYILLTAKSILSCNIVSHI